MKRALIVYSSRTGNTRKLAEAIESVMPKDTDLFAVEVAPPPDIYDLLTVGFWVDDGNADEKTQQYLRKVRDKKVALFATVGASADSEHAKKSMENARKLLDKSNTYLGEYICQGKVDSQWAEQLQSSDDRYEAMSSSGLAEMVKGSEEHPSEEDLAQAIKVFKKIVQDL